MTETVEISLTKEELKFMEVLFSYFEDTYSNEGYFEEDFSDSCNLTFDECMKTVNVIRSYLK